MAISDAQRQMVNRILGGDTTGRFLRKGKRGVSVRALQLFLRDQGIDVGRADGIFGDKTLAGLREYQKRAGLRIDGKAGARTFGAIRKGIEGSLTMPRPRPEGVSESDRMDMAADAIPAEPVASMPEPNKPMQNEDSASKVWSRMIDTDMADAGARRPLASPNRPAPPLWDGANSPLAGVDVAPPPESFAPPDFGTTKSYPDMNAPEYGFDQPVQNGPSPMMFSNPAYGFNQPGGVPGDALAEALRKRISGQLDPMGQPMPSTQSGMDPALSSGFQPPAQAGAMPPGLLDALKRALMGAGP